MPQGGAALEQAASVRHYLMKAPLSGDARNKTPVLD
jgi:hypothetical protein